MRPLVIAPVPGPSSITGAASLGSTYSAIARASMRLDGMTAPTCSGFSIQERRKRTSSSRRSGFLWTRNEDCKDISYLKPSLSRHMGTDTGKKVKRTEGLDWNSQTSDVRPRGAPSLRLLKPLSLRGGSDCCAAFYCCAAL